MLDFPLNQQFLSILIDIKNSFEVRTFFLSNGCYLFVILLILILFILAFQLSFIFKVSIIFVSHHNTK